MKKNKTVFLDRDGVINLDVDYVYRIEDFIFIEGVFDACLAFQELGYKIIIITNQAGIGRGYYSEKDFIELTSWMLEQFKLRKINIEDVYFCPHHSVFGKGKYLKSCECRKPRPGMIIKASVEHKVNIEKSFLVGDKVSDIKAGKAAGIGQNFFVRTGKLISDEDVFFADGVFDTLYDVVNFISS